MRRLGLLTALLTLGLQGEAMAGPEHHYILFRPSPTKTVVGYMLHLGTESGNYVQQVDLGQPNDDDAVLAYSTNIDTSTDLYVALSSYDENGLESVFSNEYHLRAAPVSPEPGEEPAPEPEPAPVPPREREWISDPVVDPGFGTTLAAQYAMASVGLTSDASGLISMVHGDGSVVDLTIDSLAATRDLRPTRCDLDADGDSDLVLGFGPGSDGQVALIHLENGEVSSIDSVVAGDADYHQADGQTHPACGDVDGDGRNELVIGLGAAANSTLFVFDSADTGYAPFSGSTGGGVVQVPTPGGLGGSGTGVVPALGDIDGDRRDELVVGFTAAGHRAIAILDDGISAFARHASIEDGNGIVRVASLDDDDGRGGGTYPTLGDWDGDGLDEFAIGYGAGSDSWVLFLDDAVSTPLDRYPGFLRMQVGRDEAREANETVRPAFGDIDADGRDEIVVSFGDQGSYELQVFEDQTSGTSIFRGGAGFVASEDGSARWMAAPER